MRRRLTFRLVGRMGLHFMAIALIVSGALRVAGSVNEVFAQMPGVAWAATAVSEDEASLISTSSVTRLLEGLKARETELDARERKLALRQEEITQALALIQANLEALQLAETQLQSTLARAGGALEGDVGHLTQVYEAMKPKEAAKLFEQMDTKFAAEFLARMSPTAASGILAGMSTETAYAISLIFAGRHAAVPTE